MAPEYGATCGFFPVDEKTLDFLSMTGRGEVVPAVKAYYEAQGMLGMPKSGDLDYTEVVELDLATVKPAVSGPKRPHDHIDLPSLKGRFEELLNKPYEEGGYGKAAEKTRRVPTGKDNIDVGHGDVLISAITSCTNTSNPGVMLGAGLLAKKAVEKGLRPPARVKTSLAPGSRAVTAYLENAGLMTYLNQLGYYLSGYGCTTCIGNSGPLDGKIEEAVNKNDLVAAAVLSGNRNFEARIHQAIRANFLMSPPLVVAFGLAGTVDIDLSTDPIGKGKGGEPVYLRDIWPSQEEVAAVMKYATDPEMFKKVFSAFQEGNPLWDEIPAAVGAVYKWQPTSTYVRLPPYFDGFGMQSGQVSDVRGARVLGSFGDRITTDHVSPAGG